MTAKRELCVGDVVKYNGERGIILAICPKRALKGGSRKAPYNAHERGCLLQAPSGVIGYHAPKSVGSVWWAFLKNVKLVRGKATP